MQRNGDARGEVGEHAGAIERDDFGAAIGEVVRQKAAARAEAVAGPRHVDGYLDDPYLKHIAGFGLGDRDGAGEDVTAGTALVLRHAVIERLQPGGNVGRFHAGGHEALRRPAGGGGLQDDGVARVHGEGGLGVRGIKAPGDRGGCGEQSVGSLSRGLRRCSEGGCERQGGTKERTERHRRWVHPQGIAHAQALVGGSSSSQGYLFSESDAGYRVHPERHWLRDDDRRWRVARDVRALTPADRCR